MHLAPTKVLHVFEAGDKRAEVQYIEGEKNTPFRVVFQTKKAGEVTEGQGSRYYTHAPGYFSDREIAMDRARTWAYR
jgi:hypothetical protein